MYCLITYRYIIYNKLKLKAKNILINIFLKIKTNMNLN